MEPFGKPRKPPTNHHHHHKHKSSEPTNQPTACVLISTRSELDDTRTNSPQQIKNHICTRFRSYVRSSRTHR